MLLRLGTELDSMAETETMAPETMMPEMVPLTIGTLHTKSIGLTSSTIRASAYLRRGKATF